MWFLVRKSDGKLIHLLSNKKYKIGRFIENFTTDVEIPIESDSSISRLHAELLMKYDENECINLQIKPNIILTDHSKFGTFVNECKVEGIKRLEQNDIIKFGVYKSIFQLCYEPLIVTTSCLDKANKHQVKTLVCRLGGHLVNEWQNECSLVVMTSITITVKVIDALICQKHVVSVEYLKELVNSIETNQKEHPEPKKFLPPIEEPLLKSSEVDFEPLEIRKSLFSKKKFIFFNLNQLQKIQNIIELASGKCEIFNSKIHLDLKVLKDNKDVFIFIQNDEIKFNDNQSKVDSLLKSLKQKLIDESEIGLAILFTHLKVYCNPNKNSTRSDLQINPSKLLPQTQTDTYSGTSAKNYNFSQDQEPSQIYIKKAKAAEEVTPSLALQLEDKIEDICIIADSPPPPQPKSPMPPRKRKLQSETIAADVVTSPSSTRSNNEVQRETRSHAQIVKPTIKIDDFDCLKEDFEFESDNSKVVEKINTENDKFKTPLQPVQKIFDQILPSPDKSARGQKNKRKIDQVEDKNEIKQHPIDEPKKQKESEIRLEEKIIPSKPELVAASAKVPAKKAVNVAKIEPTIPTIENLNDDGNNLTISSKASQKRLSTSVLNVSNVVYSKKKPPASSIIKHEPTSTLNESISDVKVKIKFESLIPKNLKKENIQFSDVGGKPNFKKFKKIPKAILGQVPKIGVKRKNVKQENFDVDSQFQVFMNSMR